MKHSDDYTAINKIGAELAAFREPDDSSIMINFQSLEGDSITPSGSVSVTMQQKKFGKHYTCTASAMKLGDAILLARAKCVAQHEADKELTKS